MIALVVALLSAPASGACFDLALPSAVYAPDEPVCARDDGALFAAVPECAPLEVAVVDGCLGFEPVAGLLDEKVSRRGRSIVRQLVARDACSSGWEIAYSLDRAGALRAEVSPRNRCDHVALTKSGGARALTPRAEQLSGDPAALYAGGRNPSRAVSRAALARLLLDQDNPSACEVLARAPDAPAPLPEALLKGARNPCLGPLVEDLLARPGLEAEAERALLRVYERDPAALRGALLRAVGRGQALLKVARALRPALDEHRVLKRALLGYTEGPSHDAATLSLLEVFPAKAPAWLADRVEGLACDPAAWALELDEVQDELARAAGIERRFTPLLDPRSSCERVRVAAARALVRRLAEGRPAQPAAWRLLIAALEDDPSALVRRSTLKDARARLQCGARSGELLLPAFALDALLRQGIRLPCAELPPLPAAAAERPLLDPAADPGDLEAPLDPDDAPPPPRFDAPPAPAPEDAPRAGAAPRDDDDRPQGAPIKPRGIDETHLGFFTLARLYPGGGVGGGGLHALWFVDHGFGFTASASLAGLCANCFTDSQIHRRDLRFDLGLVLFPFPELEISPYLKGSFVMGDAEIGTAARTAASFLVGLDGGVGLEWLLSDDLLVFFEGTAFLMGEAEQSFGFGVPSAPGIAPLGTEQIGGQLRVGLDFRL